ncbi:hypothetical protein FKX85_03340 [Echinicola soli]|uniref:Uncharacterized protein n=1 Tax=Echinicola soli TaxID=2591634 RepID=A0A514CE69_9BACT|nr:hypothetical protein [Echinicola soli]QDH78121.1 hypothetical protein FKX85_03340 [Echinicola soli]
MRLYLFLLFFIFSRVSVCQQVDRDIFDSTLGEEKAYAYSVLEGSFEKFLKSNYANRHSLSERIKGFLKDIQKQNINWTFDDSLSYSTLLQIEKSGLRKDILLYESEAYHERFPFEKYIEEYESSEEISNSGEIDENFEEIIEIPLTSEGNEKGVIKDELEFQQLKDKFPKPNRNGLFYYALAKAQTNNDDIIAYVSLITEFEESPSPSLLAFAFLSGFSDDELVGWENKLILIIEIYLKSIIQNDIMKNRE